MPKLACTKVDAYSNKKRVTMVPEERRKRGWMIKKKNGRQSGRKREKIKEPKETNNDGA